MSNRHHLELIDRAARRAELRMRLARSIAAVPVALIVALSLAALVLTARKVFPMYVGDGFAVVLLALLSAAVVAVALVPLVRRLPPHAGVLALDRHHSRDGRLTNALAFGSVPDRERTAMMEAAIADAVGDSAVLEPRKAVQIPVPGEFIVVGVLTGWLVLLAVLFVPQSYQAVAVLHLGGTSDALEMTSDDLAMFKEAVQEFEKQEQTPEVQRAIDEFNQLIEQIAKRELNRTEALRRMQEIEDGLLKGSGADQKALQDALKQMAKELERSEMAKPFAKSLNDNDLAQAQKDLKKLSQQLAEKGKNKPSKAELERLRRALSRAAKQKEKALEQLRERRAELRKQLLKKKKAMDQAKKPEERERRRRLLKKKRDELERLNRDIERRENAQQRLSRLDRNLAKAAEDLLRDLGMSADDFEQAAEDINRLEQQQMSDKEKEELRKRLEELRQLIRQQGGQQRLQRLKRFARRARGQRGQGQKRGRGQKPGQGQSGQRGMKPGAGKGKPGGVIIGAGGTRIPIPGGGPGDQPGGGQGDQPGGGGDGGKKWGTGRGGDIKGDETDPDMGTVDVRAEGLDNQAGPTNAEVILSAAERGFSGAPYKEVFKQYETVAEDQIDKEQIPDGMRFYVRRYFQLIRPRE